MSNSDCLRIVRLAESGASDSRDAAQSLAGDVRQLADLMLATEAVLEDLSERKTRVQALYDKVRLNLLPEAMQANGDIRSVNFEDIGRVTLTADMYVSAPGEAKVELYGWLVANGFSDLITETVNASTLKAWVSKRVKSGETIPEMVKITPFQRASITRAK